MTNYAARGNSFDLVVAKDCEKRGGLVASRRHTGGAGDLLVVWPDEEEGDKSLPTLIECKTCKRSPYENFRADKRQEMRDEAARFNGRLSLWLAWRKTGTSEIRWAHESEWPDVNDAKAAA